MVVHHSCLARLPTQPQPLHEREKEATTWLGAGPRPIRAWLRLADEMVQKYPKASSGRLPLTHGLKYVEGAEMVSSDEGEAVWDTVQNPCVDKKRTKHADAALTQRHPTWVVVVEHPLGHPRRNCSIVRPMCCHQSEVHRYHFHRLPGRAKYRQHWEGRTHVQWHTADHRVWDTKAKEYHGERVRERRPFAVALPRGGQREVSQSQNMMGWQLQRILIDTNVPMGFVPEMSA